MATPQPTAPDGNIRSYTVDGVKVNVSAFAEDKKPCMEQGLSWRLQQQSWRYRQQ